MMRAVYAGKAASDDVTRNLELSCDGLVLPRRCTSVFQHDHEIFNGSRVLTGDNWSDD